VRSTLAAILAQRLVRRLCEQCKEPYEPTPYELVQIGVDPERTRKRDERVVSPRYTVHGVDYQPVGWREPFMPTFYRPKGCERCDNKGFVGRFGIYEMLVVEDVVGRLVLDNADARTIKRAAQAQGMDTLRDDGARKVLMGQTTVEEVVAATQDDIVVDD
jgi:general secretion pathway protein E